MPNQHAGTESQQQQQQQQEFIKQEPLTKGKVLLVVVMINQQVVFCLTSFGGIRKPCTLPPLQALSWALLSQPLSCRW